MWASPYGKFVSLGTRVWSWMWGVKQPVAFVAAVSDGSVALGFTFSIRASGQQWTGSVSEGGEERSVRDFQSKRLRAVG